MSACRTDIAFCPFATGYSETASIENAAVKTAISLEKPFGVSDLEAVL